MKNSEENIKEGSNVDVECNYSDRVFNPYQLNEFKYKDNIDSCDPDTHFYLNYAHSKSRPCNYYSENEFSSLSGNFTSKSDIFSTFHINIVRSLPKNNDQLTHFMSVLNHTFSVIALSETWVKDDTIEFYNMSQYNSVHSCRKDKVGGGVAIFVHNDFQFIIRKDIVSNFDESNVESLFLEILSCSQFGKRNVIIGCIYRPPDSNINCFNDALSAALDVINDEGKLCFLLGDFNVNLFQSGSHAHSQQLIFKCIVFILLSSSYL